MHSDRCKMADARCVWRGAVCYLRIDTYKGDSPSVTSGTEQNRIDGSALEYVIRTLMHVL